MTTTKPAGALVAGDRFPHPLDDDKPSCHVDHVEIATHAGGRISRKMGTDTPMVRVFLTDGPRVIKYVELPADRSVEQ